MSGVRAGRVVKLKSGRRANRPVLRMMAIMQDDNKKEVPKEFLEGGRTGRRNAMPDILHPPGAQTSTADLPARLEQLVTTVERPQIRCDNDNTPSESEENSNERLRNRTRRITISNDDLPTRNAISSDPENPQPGPSSAATDTTQDDTKNTDTGKS